MADSTLSALTAATTPLAGTEDLYIVQGGTSKKVAASAFQAPLVSGTNIKTVNGSSLLGSGDLTVSASAGGANTQVQFNNSGELGGDAGLTYNSTTGGLTLSGKTVTTSNPVIDASQTWNNSGVTFTGIKFNVPSATYAAGSSLIDLQLGSETKFKVTAAAYPVVYLNNAAVLESYGGALCFGTDTACAAAIYDGLRLTTGGSFAWATSASAAWSGLSLALYRDADNTLAQHNGANAQTFRLYNTYGGSGADYERGFMRWNANVLEIGTESGGTNSANLRTVAFKANNKTTPLFVIDGSGFNGDARNTLTLKSSTDGYDPNLSSQWLRITTQFFCEITPALRVSTNVNRALTITSTGLSPLDYLSDFTILGPGRGLDEPLYKLQIKGASARTTATTNLVGGDIVVKGGDGASASSGAAHGGNVYVRGGTMYGTGHVGYIIMDNLPTSNPAVAGALWNNSGVLTVSAG